jgi:hypothetical protein
MAKSRLKVCEKPAMGWNSYDCFGWSVTEDEYKANVEFVARHLKPYGYQYVVVDYLWSYDGRGPCWPNPSWKDVPLRMDEKGRLLPVERRFLSGFKALGDFVHGLGLKFGIHLMRGVPKQAEKLCKEISNYDECTWCDHMYGLDMSKKGAQEYLNSCFELYAEWGVDYIKLDDASRPYRKEEIEGYRKAIDNCGRDMVLSLSPGETPLSASEEVVKVANSWRIKDDLWDNFKKHIIPTFKLAELWNPTMQPHHFPDCDMIPIGKLHVAADEKGRDSRLNKNQEKSFLMLIAFSRSPIMLGGHLPQTKPHQIELFKDKDFIHINQNTYNNKVLKSCTTGASVWHAEDDKNYYLGFFNLKPYVKFISYKHEGKKYKFLLKKHACRVFTVEKK